MRVIQDTESGPFDPKDFLKDARILYQRGDAAAVYNPTSNALEMTDVLKYLRSVAEQHEPEVLEAAATSVMDIYSEEKHYTPEEQKTVGQTILLMTGSEEDILKGFQEMALLTPSPAEKLPEEKKTAWGRLSSIFRKPATENEADLISSSKTSPDTFVVLMLLGRAANGAGNRAEAYRLFSQAVNINPTSEEAHLWAAASSDDLEVAQTHLQKALSLNPPTPKDSQGGEISPSKTATTPETSPDSFSD